MKPAPCGDARYASDGAHDAPFSRRQWLRQAIAIPGALGVGLTVARGASAATAVAAGPAAASEVGTATAPILVLGDSLSAEYGLRRGSGWVEIVGKRLAEQRPPRTIINASISGDTTAGGRARLAPLLQKHQPGIVIVELGGNDALRGLDLTLTEANLRAILADAKKAGARTLLLGMMIPPNYGKSYGEKFAGVFRSAAAAEQSALLPFFLDGVAERGEWFQPDRIHPTEQAQARLADNVWPHLEKLLKSAGRAAG